MRSCRGADMNFDNFLTKLAFKSETLSRNELQNKYGNGNAIKQKYRGRSRISTDSIDEEWKEMEIIIRAATNQVILREESHRIEMSVRNEFRIKAIQSQQDNDKKNWKEQRKKVKKISREKKRHKDENMVIIMQNYYKNKEIREKRKEKACIKDNGWGLLQKLKNGTFANEENLESTRTEVYSVTEGLMNNNSPGMNRITAENMKLLGGEVKDKVYKI